MWDTLVSTKITCLIRSALRQLEDVGVRGLGHVSVGCDLIYLNIVYDSNALFSSQVVRLLTASGLLPHTTALIDLSGSLI